MNTQERNREVELYYDLIVLNVDKFLKRNKRYVSYRDDLISEGAIGLMKSIGTYDGTKGASKVTYYSRGIRFALKAFIYSINKHLNEVPYIDNVHSEEEEEVKVNVITETDLYEKLMPKDHVNRRIYQSLLTGGMTVAELADELNLSPETICNRRVRLVKELRRKILEDSINED